MKEFGPTLQTYRKNAKDQSSGNSLTQARLVELLRNQIGVKFSPQQISYWETGERNFPTDDRQLLLAIILILVESGGINSLEEANVLLNCLGLYSLKEGEIQTIKDAWLNGDVDQEGSHFSKEQTLSLPAGDSGEILRRRLANSTETIEAMPPIQGLHMISWCILFGIFYVSIKPAHDWSFNQTRLIVLSITLAIIPLGIVWLMFANFWRQANQNVVVFSWGTTWRIYNERRLEVTQETSSKTILFRLAMSNTFAKESGSRGVDSPKTAGFGEKLADK